MTEKSYKAVEELRNVDASSAQTCESSENRLCDVAQPSLRPMSPFSANALTISASSFEKRLFPKESQELSELFADVVSTSRAELRQQTLWWTWRIFTYVLILMLHSLGSQTCGRCKVDMFDPSRLHTIWEMPSASTTKSFPVDFINAQSSSTLKDSSCSLIQKKPGQRSKTSHSRV